MLKQHYFMLVFLCLATVIFGGEFNYAISGLAIFNDQEKIEAERETGNILSIGDLYVEQKGDDTPAFPGVRKLLDKLFAPLPYGTEMAKRAENFLTGASNEAWSGKLTTKMMQAFYQLFHSESAIQALMIIGSFLWYAVGLIFVSNMIYVVVCRIFLEGRVYEKIQFHDFLFFLSFKRWFSASFTVLLTYLFESLWSLTIIGGIIKEQSYFCVPYIVGERPEMSSLEAITLSRGMMDGHKMECFLMKLSMLGWLLLGIPTFGLSEMLFGVPYRVAAYSEFYARIRKDAIERDVPGIELLDDRYLFEKADKIKLYETYFDVVDEITLIHEGRVELQGVRKFLVEKFGIWLGSLRKKKQYDDLEGREFAIQSRRECMSGNAYPHRLNPRWHEKEAEKKASFTFMRSYSIWTLFLFFIAFSVIGWGWEVALHYVQTGAFANRGTLFGPWLPIYGSGGIVVLTLCSRFRRKPVLEFLTAIVLCGTIEYFAAWYLETRYHVRWWSYDGYFLNLHGRICAQGLLVFGVACCLVTYLIAPLIDFILSWIKPKILIGCCIILAVFFGIDVIQSTVHPNMAVGAIEDEPPIS